MHTLRPLLRPLLAAAVLAGSVTGAAAQFSAPPAAMPIESPPPSAAADVKAYRLDAARHVYQTYPMLVWRGKLPPMLHAVAVVQTTVDAQGRVTDVTFLREPASAKETMPWIVQAVRRAAPYPAPGVVAPTEGLSWVEIWLVDASGRFQLDALSEGQH
jgi:hypothetical protein